MKKYSYTQLETIKSYGGDNIIFDEKVVANFYKKTILENILNLTESEKEEYFQMNLEYRDVLDIIYDSHFENAATTGWTERSVKTPTEDYENFLTLLSSGGDEGFTEEERNLKLEVLRQFKEWYELKK